MIKYLSKTKKTSLAGTALLRLDFNTKDDWRMRAVIPTIKLLLKASSKIVIVSHRGRPVGVKINNGTPSRFEKDLSLKNDAETLSRILGRKVFFIPHFRFGEIKKTIAAAPNDSLFLLENLRFMRGEEQDDALLAKQLASLADFYVNDAFAVSHRANASVTGVPALIPAYAGLELENEITWLSKAMVRPKRPLVLILGGAKASDKLGVIKFFRKKADWFILGGGSANTILSLKGFDVKNSIRDKDPNSLKELKAIASYKGVLLPIDFRWQRKCILDIGPKTEKEFGKKIAAARTIIWSGPLGFIEDKAYSGGSLSIARAIARNRRAFSVSGGGETVMFLKKYKLDKKFSFISTGGGAMVDYLAGKKLPGIEALK